METRGGRDNIIEIITGAGRIYYQDCDTGNIMYSDCDVEAPHYTIDHSEPLTSPLLVGNEFKDWADYFILARTLETLSIHCPYRGVN